MQLLVIENQCEWFMLCTGCHHDASFVYHVTMQLLGYSCWLFYVKKTSLNIMLDTVLHKQNKIYSDYTIVFIRYRERSALHLSFVLGEEIIIFYIRTNNLISTTIRFLVAHINASK